MAKKWKRRQKNINGKYYVVIVQTLCDSHTFFRLKTTVNIS